MRRVPSQQRNSRIQRDRDLRALSRLAFLLVCGLVLAGGFVYAARQHVAAIGYGYQREMLRQERERLLAENQQLLLQREQAFAPARLAVQARELGLRPMQASQVGAQQLQRMRTIAPALLNGTASLQR